MALAAIVVGLVNALTFIAASNTNNMPYLKSMLEEFIHFDACPSPIPTADEEVQHELYLLSFTDGDAPSGGIPAGVHHPPPAAAAAAAAGRFDILLIVYYLALAILVLYHLFLPCVRGRARKRAKAEAESKQQEANRILQKERAIVDSLIRENSNLKRGSEAQDVITRADKEELSDLTRENNELRQGFKAQEVITRADKEKLNGMTRENDELRLGSKAQEVITRADIEKLKKLTVENSNLKAHVERTETELQEARTRSLGSGEAVRNLIKENNFLKNTLRSNEHQTEDTEIKLGKVEESKRELETELARTKIALVEANTLKSKSEALWNKGVADLEKELQERKTSSQNAENSKIRAVELLTKEKTDLKTELDLATTKLQRAEESNSELGKNFTETNTLVKELEPLAKENAELKTKLEWATGKLQRVEKSFSELEKNLAQANSELKELEPLTKKNIDLQMKLVELTTKSERAEESKYELEKKLTQANTGLKDLEALNKENIDLKKNLEWATDTLQLAEKSKSELNKNMSQTNDGLRVQLRKAKVMLKETEDSKVSELDLLAKVNADRSNQLQGMKNYGKGQESDDAEKEKAVNRLVNENTDLKGELQKVMTILQEAEAAKSELKANLAESNTRLETDLEKERAIWTEEEESKAREFDKLVKKNVDLTNQLRRFEAECKQQEVEDAKRDQAESKAVEDKDEASTAFLKELSELRKENDKLKEGIRCEKFYQNTNVAQASTGAVEYANRIQTLEAALGNPKEKPGFKSELRGMESEGKNPSGDVEEETTIPKEKLEDEDEQKNKDTKMWDDERDMLKQGKADVWKRIKEGKPNEDDPELQGTMDATPEAHTRHTPDVLALTPDATLLSGNTGPKRPVALTPAQSENSTSNTSPHMLLATMQSAPLTPNNRADMSPTAGELDRMDSKPSLSRAPKPIASADVLGVSMSNSSYAPNYNTSKAPFVRGPVGSSADPK